jgi:hypothetical protein
MWDGKALIRGKPNTKRILAPSFKLAPKPLAIEGLSESAREIAPHRLWRPCNT